MILKYIVPKKYRKNIYDNKKTIYCKVLEEQEFEGIEIIIYKVKMLNYNNFTNIFSGDELEKLNVFDKIKLKLGGYKDE